jgi:hypothetical protein
MATAYFIYAHPASRKNIECHLEAVWLLISHGAERLEDRIKPVNCGRKAAHDNAKTVVKGTMPLVSMQTMLTELFGACEAEAMQQRLAKNNRAWGWQTVLSWLHVGPQRQVVGEATQFVWEQERSARNAFHANSSLALSPESSTELLSEAYS